MIIKIIAKTQQLTLIKDGQVLKNYTISTAKKGLGEMRGSEMTPRGWHKIQLKIGENFPVNTVFVGRRPTGETYSEELAKAYPERDWILTRILWLTGLEPGINRYGIKDTRRRYIYIHGCPDHLPMGIPSSHGCIRMRNIDIVDLFSIVPTHTAVLITEEDHAITSLMPL